MSASKKHLLNLHLSLPLYFKWSLLIILFFLLLFGIFIRFFSLESNPAGIFPDEASTGYDAWSLLLTGYDQHGSHWPFFFISFADDLSGTYRYLVLTTELFLGPTIYAVRLPAAIIGFLTCVFVFLIIKFEHNYLTAAITSCFILFSPWHLPYSRTGQRIVLLPFSLTVWYLLRNIWLFKDKISFYYLSWLFLGLSLYTYVPARLIIPLLGIFLLLFDLKNNKLSKFSILKSFSLFLLTFLPMILHAFHNPALFKLRFSQVSVFNRSPDILSAFTLITKNYFQHFSLSYLLLNGDLNLRHSQKGFGELLFSQVFFLAVALYSYLKKFPNKQRIVIFFLLVISPLPAALSTDGNPHALRSIGMLLPWIIITSDGVQYFYMRLFSKQYFKILLITIIVLALECFSVGYDFVYKYPVYSAKAWEYGTREAISVGMELSEYYDEIWFTNKAMGADRIIAFVLKIPPRQFIRIGLTATKFRWIWNLPLSKIALMDKNSKILYITREDELLNLPEVHPPIIRPDGSIAFKFKSKNPNLNNQEGS